MLADMFMCASSVKDKDSSDKCEDDQMVHGNDLGPTSLICPVTYAIVVRVGGVAWEGEEVCQLMMKLILIGIAGRCSEKSM